MRLLGLFHYVIIEKFKVRMPVIYPKCEQETGRNLTDFLNLLVAPYKQVPNAKLLFRKTLLIDRDKIENKHSRKTGYFIHLLSAKSRNGKK